MFATTSSSTSLRYVFILGSFLLLLGLLLTLSLQLGIFPNPLLEGQITVDLGTLILLGSGLCSSGIWARGILLWYKHRWSRSISTTAKQHYVAQHQRFIRRLEHEMKNPLAIIQVSLINLEQRSLEAQERQALHTANMHLQSLVRDLRKLDELTTYALEFETVNLAQLLQETIAAIQSVNERSAYTITLNQSQIPWLTTEVMGDADLLTLAFYNLLDNACKFSQPDAIIEVRIHTHNKSVTVDIADNGPGIDGADLPYIFEELYRGKNTQNISGSGLGLAVVQKIVTCHDGNITVRSQLGQGTMFSVQLAKGKAAPNVTI